MTTVEDAFAAWRLAHPGEHGWPLYAFKAGWEAARQVTTAQHFDPASGEDALVLARVVGAHGNEIALEASSIMGPQRFVANRAAVFRHG